MPKKVTSSATQDRKGVAAIQRAVTTELGWIFREQPTEDYGIDAQIELVESGAATGRLIAAQIKSGTSYFSNAHPDGWWFRLDKDDLEYWLDHALPVLVLLYNPETDRAYWEAVNHHTIVTGKRGGKKLLVPKAQQLGRRGRLRLFAAGSIGARHTLCSLGCEHELIDCLQKVRALVR